jgi:hypothetical protein
MLEWVKQRLAIAEDPEKESFESCRAGVSFSAKITPCQNNGECLLILEKHPGEWDLDSVRNSLGLTFREAEILMWISRGKTNNEVGVILGSSPCTINIHLEHIFEKTGRCHTCCGCFNGVAKDFNLICQGRCWSVTFICELEVAICVKVRVVLKNKKKKKNNI